MADKRRFAPPSPSILNAGLQGAGVQNFYLLERWLSSQMDIHNVVFIVISNDFKRPVIADFWKGKEACLDEGKCDAWSDYWWSFDAHISDEELMQVSRARLRARNVSLFEQVKNTLNYHSYSYRMIHRALQGFYAVAGNGGEKANDERRVWDDNFHAFLRLREHYPNLKVILMPQRDEIGLFGAENADTKAVKAFFAENDVKYKFCRLAQSDYMPIDGHPNKQGYHKLLECLAGVIQNGNE